MQSCKTTTDETLRETVAHGSDKYPIAYYVDNIMQFDHGRIDWHWHREVEFVTVSKGSINCLIGQNRIRLEKGWGIFINSGIIHRFETDDDGIMSDIVFAPELIATERSLIHETYILPVLSSGPAYQILNPNVLWQNTILVLLNQIYDIQDKNRDSLSPLNTLLLTTELWKHLFQNINIEPVSENGVKSTFQSSRLQVMMQFIHDHYAEDIGLEDIGKATNISKSSTLEVFRRGINQSPISYLIEYRLTQAAFLLKNTKNTISNISLTTGFSSNSYFCRKFKCYYKMTPAEYRKQVLHNSPSL
ncbi:AraC family transcriptional regulator [Tissierella carlieri]|uniref:AraC family transcriptional regulator n=1 Tax=Tissierella carlieri TaxID=689904 RepID=UPI001C10D0DE|nr:AraC family transcriptional regulator [Tissierella carlieri]MBU5310987.1 AraC family transcriptional regulator [Tissierella carlieri]